MSESPSISPDKKIPATSILLTGKHLIEASAGTGKTWTLTGIVLRLLIEARRPPEQIICTTFTRAASAEMRERIVGRLHQFYRVVQWLDKLCTDKEAHSWLLPMLNLANNDGDSSNSDNNNNNDSNDNNNSEREENSHHKQNQRYNEQREPKLIEQAKQTDSQLAEWVQDPVNLYLSHYLLNNHYDYPLSMTIRRMQLLMVSMDKMFVSTLDSLAQKWLSEYSVETGYQKGMKISENDEDKVADIVHDEIRQFHARTHATNPTLYQLLQQSGKLTAVDDHIQSVNKAMQFISAPIDDLQGFDFDRYQRLINAFSEQGIEDIRSYFDESHRKKQGLNGRTNLFKLLPMIADVFTCIQQHQAMYFLHLEADHQKLLEAISKVVIDPENKGFGFNKNKEVERNRFINLPTVQALFQLSDLIDSLDNEILVLNRQIALAVRHRLPIQLEENNQTTFSLQMVRLNQALSGRQGKNLARYIRHHYPVALIDESQDIDSEQASMVRSIYMQKEAVQDKVAFDNRSKGKSDKPIFLLLVGDPKQAIYGFRGGDVANYTAMKTQFSKKNQMTLNVNRRSNAKIIDSLNQWFGCNEESDSPHLKALGDGIEYLQIEAFKETSGLSWHNDNNPLFGNSLLGKQAVSVIHAYYAKKGEEQNEKGADQYEGLARHIQYLLNSKETLEGKPITPKDIAILARGRKGLQQASWALEKLGIATVKTAVTSVYSSQMATDLLAILQAMQHPFRNGFVNRALTTNWYGLTLQQVKKLEKASHSVNSIDFMESLNNVSYSNFQIHLQKSEQLWSDYGVLSALQFLLGDCLFTSSHNSTPKNAKGKTKKTSVWEQLASGLEGERNLLDLRQLLELLTSNTRGMTATEVVNWLALQRHKLSTDESSKQHPVPTESGVQMMTTHKSKGLEFPIVYVLGMDGSAKKSVTGLEFFPYILKEGSNNQRRLSPVKQDVQKGIDFQALVNDDNLGEEKRIAYVALTRASEQVYVVVRDHDARRDLDYRPANIWLESADKTYTLPERLTNHVDWIECAEIVDNAIEQADNQSNNKSSNSNKNSNNVKNANEGHGQNSHQPERINYPNYDDIIQKKYFVGWRKTSFTALSRQLDKSSEDMAVSEPDYLFEDMFEDRIEDGQTDMSISSLNGEVKADLKENGLHDLQVDGMFTEDDIRFTFVRGAGAGTFLHQVLEMMDFNNPHTWSEQINKGLRQYGLPTTYQSVEDIPSGTVVQDNEDAISNTPHQQLKSWLTDVLHSPLVASGQKLIDIPDKACKAEMGFDMGIGDGFRAEHINQVLIKHLGEDSDKLLTLTASDTNHYYRYLRGEIDLVYTHDGKYYVVDYKSNHLGNHISDYSQCSLAKAMSKAGYWLQALIYQVALHRFLRLRLADYRGNEVRYLGAVEYLFMRGCITETDAESEEKEQPHLNLNQYGKITWDIPFALVKDMDEVFGC